MKIVKRKYVKAIETLIQQDENPGNFSNSKFDNRL